MNWLKKHWLLTLILIIALVLRLYRIGETMTFLEDEGRDLLIATRMIETGRPVLLGPQTSTGSMYLGPLYYYFITPALYLAQMNPVGPAILIALTGVAASYLLFIFARRWFSKRAGYLAALLFAVLPLSVTITRASWNPHLVPLVSILMLIYYARITFAKPRLLDWLIYGSLIGVMVQLHYMALIFCAVVSLLIVWFMRTKLGELAKGIALAIVGALIMLAPFILFELRNDWVNTKAITSFMESKDGSNIRYTPPLWLWWDKVATTSYRLIGKTLTGSELTTSITTLVTSLAYILLLLASLRTWIKTKTWLPASLVVILLACLAILGIYQENIHLHYLEFGVPLICVLLAIPLGQKSKSFTYLLACGITIASLALGVPRTLGYITSDPTHQNRKAREVAEYIVKKAGNEPYNVVSTQGMYTTPFQYYLTTSDHPPSNELAPRIFDICAGAPCVEDEETTTLLFLTGPAHPSIAQYLGHPQLNSFDGKRKIVSNEHVSYGIWVAEIVLE